MSSEIKQRVVYVLTRTNKADDDDTDVYIGSTFQSLKRRLWIHRGEAKRANSKLYKRIRTVGIQSWEIIPLLSRTCDKKTILELERKWCKIMNADLNTILPIRTPDEKRQNEANYRELHRDAANKYNANYYRFNIQNKRYHCDICNHPSELIGFYKNILIH